MASPPEQSHLLILSFLLQIDFVYLLGFLWQQYFLIDSVFPPYFEKPVYKILLDLLLRAEISDYSDTMLNSLELVVIRATTTTTTTNTAPAPLNSKGLQLIQMLLLQVFEILILHSPLLEVSLKLLLGRLLRSKGLYHLR